MVENLAYAFIRSCVAQIVDLKMYPEKPDSISKRRSNRPASLYDTYIPWALFTSLEIISPLRAGLRSAKSPDNRLDAIASQMYDSMSAAEA